MVLVPDGNSTLGGTDLGSNLCYLICLRHLINSRAVTNIFSPKRLHACACVLSYHLIKAPWADHVNIGIRRVNQSVNDSHPRGLDTKNNLNTIKVHCN